MMFRIRRYQVVPGKTKAFNDFFLTRLFPVQKRYGARLVGRFQTDDGLQIIAVWVYQSFDHYKEVQSLVAEDADSIAAQEFCSVVLTRSHFVVVSYPFPYELHGGIVRIVLQCQAIGL